MKYGAEFKRPTLAAISPSYDHRVHAESIAPGIIHGIAHGIAPTTRVFFFALVTSL
jgi:hypothetical protein